jgi:hypothetical protein
MYALAVWSSGILFACGVVGREIESRQDIDCLFLDIKNSSFAVDRVHGEVLVLHKVKRSQMGSYLCIASNGHPPTVSSRAILKINCESHILEKTANL